MQAAFLACESCGISAEVFLKCISNFTGASKRLELLATNMHTNVYRDFAHAPSKVNATIHAVKQQFPGRKLIAVLELHTYSSLNKDFLTQYNRTMDDADKALVFYSGHALELKKMPELPMEKVYEGFGKPGLIVANKKEVLYQWLKQQSYENANLLLMSSGNYDGLDILTFAREIAP